MTEIDRGLAELRARELSAPPIPPELARALGDLKPVTPRQPARQLAVSITVAGCYAAAMLGVQSIRRDLGELPVIWVIGVGVAWSVGFALAMYFAFIPRRGAVMARWRAAAAIGLVTSVAFIVLGLLAHPSGPSSGHYGWPRFVNGHSCLVLGLGVAVVPAVIGAMFLRRSMPVRARWIAATLGAGGGCLGGLVLHFYCRIADGPHIGFVHGGVVGCAAMLATLLLPRAIDT
jgi:Negative regulator of sigma F